MLPIHKSRLLLRGLAGGLLALFFHCAVAQDAGTLLSTQYPPGSIATVEAAESAQQQAASENARIELQYDRDEQACNGMFFVSTCRDKAKERRHAALEPVRLVKNEAEMVIRRMRVADRDQALADKRREKALEALQIEQDAQQKAQEIAQKKMRNIEKKRENVQNEQLHAQNVEQRAADHQARQQRMPAAVAADAQKRADNVAAYDRKIREAQAHQRDIAAQKAEKDRNRKVQSPAVPPAGAIESLPSPLNPGLAIPKP
ncbi:MAG: hypothetical protein HHJ12_16325 [Glaciimonas sp.]|nr:hypothetical protein [Glaciimonas sp.]